jgi:hypothetical protein
MPDYEKLTDAELVTAFGAGDRDAFAGIYNRYAARIYSYCLTLLPNPDDAADAAHSVFLKAAERLNQPESRHELRLWLFAVAREEAHGAGRHRARVTPEDDDSEPIVVEPDPALGVEREEMPEVQVVPAPLALKVRVLGSVGNDPAAAATRGVDWAKMAVFAAVALVIGLIGVAVGARFTPSGTVSTNPVVAPPAGDSTTTTSEPSAATTTEPRGAASTAVSSPLTPASFAVAQDTIDFGSDGTSAQIDLANDGGQVGAWEIASSSPAISVSSGGGDLGAGESTPIQVSLDRSQVAEGDLSESLTITWDGGEAHVTVVATHEDNPIIHNPRASPSEVQVDGGPSCSTTHATISARVRDTSQLASVVVRWSPSGSGTQETAMIPVGNDIYEGVIGPFTIAQSAAVKVVAIDERGNAGGASITVGVIACP